MNQTPEVIVVFLLGWGRSGTTLLDRLLGSTTGAFSAGEAHYLWSRGALEGRLCECGFRVRDCPVWREVIARVTAECDVTPAEIVYLQRQDARLRQTGRLLRRSDSGPLSLIIESTYRHLAAVTNSRVVVDSSKRPSDAAMLVHSQQVYPFFLHMVRDPRAVGHSWSRPKESMDPAAPQLMVQHGTTSSAINWILWNIFSELVGHKARHYYRLRYEDLVAAPRTALGPLLRVLGSDGTTIPTAPGEVLDFQPGHMVSGNPDRFARTQMHISADESWREHFPTKDAWATLALTLPLFKRYRYHVW